MAFTDYGYDKIRGYLVSQISHVGIYNGATQIVRLPITTAGFSVADDAVGNKLTVTAILKGDGTTHASIAVGTTVDGMKLYDGAAASNEIDGETYTSFTFNNTADQLTLKITINAPAV